MIEPAAVSTATARVVVAGTSSGTGKTTVACGLMAALRARGRRVQGFKVGPDYIDPSYHALACGRPGRNLDAFMSGSDLIAPLFRHGVGNAEVAVVEGVMGMFDGASGRGDLASTAQVAKLLRAPVLLVVNASSMARSAAALVHGFRSWDPDVEVAGVILNRVGSDHHDEILREAVGSTGVPVVGALRRDERIEAPSRHLGLVPAHEREAHSRATLATLAEAIARDVDIDAVETLARGAPPLDGPRWSPHYGAAPVSGARVAIARGPAFSFHYQENLELLEGAGAELLPFDPLLDPALPPDADALVLAGGFPEVFGAELSANASLRAEVAAFAASGRPLLAECGGLLFLCSELDGHEMCGVLAARAQMGTRLSLGYREATALQATPWLDAGERVRGHEFHYSRVEPASGDGGGAAWTLAARGSERAEGFVTGGVQASYLHVHWAAFPEVARRFVAAASAARSAVA